jgi:hypothetical protein
MTDQQSINLRLYCQIELLEAVDMERQSQQGNPQEGKFLTVPPQ